MADGCLIIRDPAGDAIGVSWASPGTEWDPDSGTLTLRGTVARLGQTVHLGGGSWEVTAENVGDFDWDNPPRPECLAYGVWFAYLMYVEE